MGSHYIRQAGFAPQGPFPDEKVLRYIAQGKVRPGMQLSEDGQVWVLVEHHPLHAQATAPVLPPVVQPLAEPVPEPIETADPVPDAEHVECPECAELVRVRARTCRHCGHDLTGKSAKPRARWRAQGAPSRGHPMLVVVAKSPGVALLLSLFIPAAGQMYAGAIGTGVMIMFGVPLGCIVLPWIVFGVALDRNDKFATDLGLLGVVGGILMACVFWLWQCFDAVSTTRRFNAAMSAPRRPWH